VKFCQEKCDLSGLSEEKILVHTLIKGQESKLSEKREILRVLGLTSSPEKFSNILLKKDSKGNTYWHRLVQEGAPQNSFEVLMEELRPAHTRGLVMDAISTGLQSSLAIPLPSLGKMNMPYFKSGNRQIFSIEIELHHL